MPNLKTLLCLALCLALPATVHARKKKPAPERTADDDEEAPARGDAHDEEDAGPDAKRPPAEEPAAPAGLGARMLGDLKGPAVWHGVELDVLGGFQATPSSVDWARVNMDRFAGVRVGYSRHALWLNLGGELTWRSTAPAPLGAQPIWQLATLSRMTGGTPQQVIRQMNQLALGGRLALRLARMAWFFEPQILGGLAASHTAVLVTLESPLPYNASFWTVGGYVGAGFVTGLEPVFVRFDAELIHQLGRPTFGLPAVGVQMFFTTYNVSVGIRL
ncbi:MAG: hypothetical protein HY904_16420 [Deltaproteobacteria bacterium]|nr:hypothetical protein [Deltaproteobacteria bacterium]